jgi:hypothetical protein
MNSPKVIEDKIKDLHKNFLSVLDDFKKYYVYYNKNPEVDEFNNYYLQSKSQLQNLSKELYLISEECKKNIDSLNSQIINNNIKLRDEKKLNDKLNIAVSKLDVTNDNSKLLITDSKDSYNEQYIINWEIFIGIFIVAYTLNKISI